MSKILFILTSHDRMLDGAPTGLWLEEFAVPYLAFTDAGHEVAVSSMAGGPVLFDPRSKPTVEQAWAWVKPMDTLADTTAFDELETDDFDAVFLPGGHGASFDMPYNRKLHELLFRFEANGRVIASVCHAPAVFGGMRRPDGTPFIKGRRVAAFTDAEERAGHTDDKIPFLLEARLRELGARHVWGENGASNAVRDGRLVTGQNPSSSVAVAELVLGLL